MSRREIIFLFFLFFFLSIKLTIGQSSIDKVLPSNWSISKYISVSSDNLPAFSRKLGGRLISIENYIINTNVIPLQINIIKCASEKDAEMVYNTLISMHQQKEKCLNVNNVVYEFICANLSMVKKARSLFSANKETIIWEVELQLAPLTKATDMEWNNFFNLLRQYKKNENNAQLKETILENSKYFEFGDKITFNNEVIDNMSPKYQIGAVKIENIHHDLISFKLNDIQKKLGIPKIKVTASIPFQGFSNFKPPYPVDVDFYTKPNKYWPSNDPIVLPILDKILKDCHSNLDKLKAIQQWVFKNIKYDGIIGSRYGTLKVLQQTYGRCWDRCDVLITFCRAAKIPLRQIAGWINGMGGHIWAEAYIQNESRIRLDPTASFLGVSDDYIPFFIIESGKIPAVYWTLPVPKKRKLYRN